MYSVMEQRSRGAYEDFDPIRTPGAYEVQDVTKQSSSPQYELYEDVELPTQNKEAQAPPPLPARRAHSSSYLEQWTPQSSQ